MASAHGLGRNTVVAVYERLAVEGLLESGVGRGSFVAPGRRSSAGSESTEHVQPRLAGPLAVLATALRHLPDHLLGDVANARPFALGIAEVQHFARRSWQQSVSRVMRERWREVLAPGEAQGVRELRESIARMLPTTRGIECDANQVVITQGSQQAIDLVMRAVVDPGAEVWVEDPGYVGLRVPALAVGGGLVSVPVDQEGLDVEAVSGWSMPRVIVATPAHQFPLGVSLSARRRAQLLQFAERTRSWILEDDYDGDFLVGSVPHLSLRSMDPTDRVIYAGTFSKSLASGLRLGFLVLPRALVPVVSRLRYLEGQHGSQLEQLALADFLQSGAFSRHVATMKRIYARRRRLLLDRLEGALPRGVELNCPKGALHAVLRLPGHSNDEQLARDAQQLGLDVRPLGPLYLHVERRIPGLLLGLGAVSDTSLVRACASLGELVRTSVGSVP